MSDQQQGDLGPFEPVMWAGIALLLVGMGTVGSIAYAGSARGTDAFGVANWMAFCIGINFISTPWLCLRLGRKRAAGQGDSAFRVRSLTLLAVLLPFALAFIPVAFRLLPTQADSLYWSPNFGWLIGLACIPYVWVILTFFNRK